jgi:signal transduction histidine kinase
MCSAAMKSADDPDDVFDDDVSELKRLADGLMLRREAERSQLAAQLGSRIASPVVVAKYMIEDAMRRLEEGDANGVELLDDARGGLRRVLSEVQRFSTELHPSMLDDLGLLPTIEWYCRTYQQAHDGMRVERQLLVNEADLRDEVKLPMFRVLEEALSNVARHANATHVQVLLMRVSDGVLLTVRDDGDGFDPAAVPPRSGGERGIGLASVRQRVEASGGQLTLEALPNGGARVTAAWSDRMAASLAANGL